LQKKKKEEEEKKKKKKKRHSLPQVGEVGIWVGEVIGSMSLPVILITRHKHFEFLLDIYLR
jgi:hypothetical protein